MSVRKCARLLFRNFSFQRTLPLLNADLLDPRTFPDAAAAPPESARLHVLAAASQAAATQDAATIDRKIVEAFAAMLSEAYGEHLATVFATAPSVAVYRHLWRILVQCEQAVTSDAGLGVTLFALPLVLVAGIDRDGTPRATLPCVLDDATALCSLLREHGALAGNQSFALANVLVSAAAIDFARLPELLTWRALPEITIAPHILSPASIELSAGPETVHLRFLPGSAIATPGADLLRSTDVGKWGIPFTQALGRQITMPGTSVLVLPRAPMSLLHAVRQGRAAQRDIGMQIFASNAIRKLRAAVGEPTAVISAHRAEDAIDGGELRLSLSSPFDPREAEGFRCPLYPLDRAADVVAMLRELLAECRVTDVRVVAGIHADRDQATGLPLFFKGDAAPMGPQAIH